MHNSSKRNLAMRSGALALACALGGLCRDAGKVGEDAELDELLVPGNMQARDDRG